MKRLSKKKNQLLLISGNAVSYMGDLFFLYAFNWWLISKTGDTKIIGIISSIVILPMLILNIIGGTTVDILNRKKIMIICDFINGILMTLLGIISINNPSIKMIALIYILTSAIFAFFSIASRSIVSEVINSNDIVSFNAWFTSVENIIKVLSPIISISLINIVPIYIIFLINGITFIFSGISEIFIDYHYNKKNHKKRENGIVLFKDGIKYIWLNNNLRTMILTASLVNFFISGYNLYIPLFSNNVLNSSIAYSGALTAEALGAIFVVLTSKLFSKYDEKIITNGIIFIFMGTSLLLIQFKIIIVLYISTFLFGLFLGQFNVSFFSYVQKNVDSEYQGRVFSVIFTLVSLLIPLGNLFFGFLGKYVIQYGFYIIGFGIILISSYFIVKNNESLEYK
ncbi:MFS transporter [Marinitoga litoralis]|jgi:MFS family permease|uniref:MFS transporter n=1 Tax=Marinitoga litoralis TaxID=570855 RepID=UPI0019613F88|nr:MFS transporter [Marinitoga litoralis]MBM7558987.1 MFS family permease [Marinitoga litoralis]